MMKNDSLDTLISILSGEAVTGAIGIGLIGWSRIMFILANGSIMDFGFLALKTLILAFLGGFGGLLAKYVWSKAKKRLED